jgi:hypothetical protein
MYIREKEREQIFISLSHKLDKLDEKGAIRLRELNVRRSSISYKINTSIFFFRRDHGRHDYIFQFLTYRKEIKPETD